jgi:hypothetical protein
MRDSFRELLSPFERRSPIFIGLLCLGAAIPAFFAFYTHLAWEDFLITYRFSENLAHGHGFVYNPGERVYGFTSPLNALLPALFAVIFAAKDFVLPLWLFRAVSLAGLIFAWISIVSVFARGAEASRIRTLIGFLFPVIAALEIKSTAFAMSGQEAGLVLGFLAPAFAIAILGWGTHRILGGVLWAGLFYSRPDAFVYIGAIALAAVVFESGPRKPLLVALAQSALICVLLYLPWVVFTWVYYGSPIPHTVVAKHNLVDYAPEGYGPAGVIVALFQSAPSVICWAISPIYDTLKSGPGSWPSWLHDSEMYLELFTIFYWLVPSRDRFGRMASLVSLVLLVYLTYTDLASQHCPWYFPPLSFMSLVTLASAAATIAEKFSGAALRYACAAVMVSGLLFYLGYIFFSSLAPIRFKEVVIDGGQRREIGLWLKDHVGPKEVVYLEPLGYIGYYSGCRMADWPGLISPEVVKIRDKIGPTKAYFTWKEVAEALKPEWIVARPNESWFMQQSDYLSHHYELVMAFDSRKAVDDLGLKGQAPGMHLAYSELIFGIYHRTD